MGDRKRNLHRWSMTIISLKQKKRRKSYGKGWGGPEKAHLFEKRQRRGGRVNQESLLGGGERSNNSKAV